MLFTYRKADPVDANLLFFLTDFTDKERKRLKEDLGKTFVMGSNSSRKERILEGVMCVDD